jgi:probable F420-dependent oxidoreductase
MDFGIILPSYRVGATTESIDAAAETAARLGWHSAFTTDHILVEPSDRSEDYFNVFDAVATLAHVAARHTTLKVGVSVIVVPMRNAVALAKELATIDALSGGRLIAGVGVGWNATEFGYVGATDVFHRRGAYLDEAIALWRHLWSGSEKPFHGSFHSFEEVRFGPLPAQGEHVPVWVGGRDARALQRAGRLGDGYHSSATGPSNYAPRVPVIRAAAAEAGRPEPVFSARSRVAFDATDKAPYYRLAGSPDDMLAELRAFAELGVSHVAVDFAETDAEKTRDSMERFDREVVAALR